MRILPPPASAQFGAFTVDQALSAGWTSHALRHAVRTRRIERLWSGVYAAPVADDAAGRQRRLVQQSVAAALANAGVLASHLAAAAVWSWPIWAPDPRACATTDGAALTRLGPVHVHRCPVRDDERSRRLGVPVTGAGRTVVDVAREYGTEAGVVVTDAALRSGTLTRTDLAAAVGHAAGRPAIGAARDLLSSVDELAESPLESRSRYRMARHGLPAPRPQVRIHDEDGRFLARVDFYWDEFGVVGEADGKLEYLDLDARYREKRRQAALTDTGLVYVDWGWDDLSPFEATAAKLRRAFGRGETVVARRRWIARGPDVGVSAVLRAISPR